MAEFNIPPPEWSLEHHLHLLEFEEDHLKDLASQRAELQTKWGELLDVLDALIDGPEGTESQQLAAMIAIENIEQLVRGKDSCMDHIHDTLRNRLADVLHTRRGRVAWNFKTATITSDEEILMCGSCEEVYPVGMMALVFPCTHHYHIKCVADWLLTYNACPECMSTSE